MHRHFRLPALAALFLTGAFSVWAADTPVKGGTLIYLEHARSKSETRIVIGFAPPLK